MQAGINRLGKLFTDAGGFGDLIDTGAAEFLQPAEMFQQVATALGPYPGHLFQARHAAGLATPGAVPGDGETVGFVADLLDQVQRRGVALEDELMVHVIEVEGLESGLARHALGDAEQGQVGKGQLLHDIAGHIQLAFAAVHQQHVGQFALAVLDPAITTGQRLVHGGVVVASGNAFDIEAAVIGLDRAFRAEHHATGHGGFAAGVADVVAFQALRHFIQAKHLGQGFEA
ncbi:hypothetical protein D3C81_1341040 [compost metagenome]